MRIIVIWILITSASVKILVRKRGRPRKYHNDEDRMAANRESNQNTARRCRQRNRQLKNMATTTINIDELIQERQRLEME